MAIPAALLMSVIHDLI